MSDFKELEQAVFEAQVITTRLSTQIANCKDRNERLRLMNELKAAHKQHDVASNNLAAAKRTELLKAQQAERDRIANRQDNSSGKSRNRQRDIT